MADENKLIVPNGTKALETQTSLEPAVPTSSPVIEVQSHLGNGLPRVSFSESDYHGQTSVLVTVNLSAKPQDECRVNFTAKELSANRERVIVEKELVFQNTQDSMTFTVDVGPNFSGAVRLVRLELSQPTNAELGDPHVAEFVCEPIDSAVGYVRSLLGTILSDPSTSRVVRHLLLALILVAAVFALDKLVAGYADSHQKDWDVYLNPPQKPDLVFPEPAPASAAGTMSNVPVFAAHEQNRLKDQLLRIRRKQDFHLNLMAFYYKGYYMGIIILSFTGALAAISLVLISKKGWAATSEYVITTFFIMTCAALFYGSWAGLFKQEENITNNKVLYLKYTALENELFSYVTTGEALRYDVTSEDLKAQASATPQSTTSTTPSTKKSQATTTSTAKPDAAPDPEKTIGIPLLPSVFIHYVDLQLAQDNIAIGFDYSQIPNYKNAFSNIGNGK